MVGARSAVFAPLPSLGVICIDEEHDASYKQESDPRYDARTVAAKRAALEGAVAIFGSATPRPESWHALERLELGGRIGAPLPTVRVVDLRHETGYPLSTPLLAELGRLAEDGRQGDPAAQPARRRARSPLPRLRRHPPLRELRRRLHPARGRDAALPPLRRPRARRRDVSRLAARPSSPGSEPGRSGSSASSSATSPSSSGSGSTPTPSRSRRSSREALERFARAERAVLVGTQMVAKGHHFTGVELAAVVDADTGLGLPDFRAEERTFQLAHPARRPQRPRCAGTRPRSRRSSRSRARSSTPRATTSPASSRASSSGGAALGYPPFRHLVRVLVSGPGPRRRDPRARGAEGRPAGVRAARPRAAAAGCAAVTAPSSSARPTGRARSRPGRRRCSPPPRLRCVAPASRPSSTSIPRASDAGAPAPAAASAAQSATRSAASRSTSVAVTAPTAGSGRAARTRSTGSGR